VFVHNSKRGKFYFSTQSQIFINNLLLLSLENKILLYKTIIKPIWAYGASKSNISIIQRSQSKILRMIANASWYVPNIILHEDLKVPLVKEVIK
jgi:hypothetical protein